jgi:uncharacterized DUF497 family protein
MIIEFDPVKNAMNFAKHGVYLSDASKLDWNAIVIYEDRRRDYNETRYIGYSLIGTRLYCAVFTIRNDVYRIISFRKANDRELDRYEKDSKTNP